MIGFIVGAIVGGVVVYFFCNDIKLFIKEKFPSGSPAY